MEYVPLRAGDNFTTFAGNSRKCRLILYEIFLRAGYLTSREIVDFVADSYHYPDP